MLSRLLLAGAAAAILATPLQARDANAPGIGGEAAGAAKPRRNPASSQLPPPRPGTSGGQVQVAAAAPVPATPQLAAPAFLSTLLSPPAVQPQTPLVSAATPRARIDALIAHHARLNGVPESLVHRVVIRESRYNPRAVGRGGAMGLMQIKTATARGMGYTGGPSGLLDAETNLTYAVKYLAGAYKVARGNHDLAVQHYARGYYYAAKRQGLVPGRYRRAGADRIAEAENPALATPPAPAALSFLSLLARGNATAPAGYRPDR